MNERDGARVEVVPNGPYRVTGAPVVRFRPVVDEEGDRVEWERGPELAHDESYELCRCGLSANKPFCDGSERQAGFDGTEVADRAPTATRRSAFGEGPVVLTDDRSLCTRAGFCHVRDVDAWGLAWAAADPEARDLMIAMVRRCPSGRLLYFEPPDPEPVEQELAQEVGVVANGPLWVRGSIPITAADGFEYERRNRVTLCRCGQSQNKPFCDGSHVGARFRDP